MYIVLCINRGKYWVVINLPRLAVYYIHIFRCNKVTAIVYHYFISLDTKMFKCWKCWWNQRPFAKYCHHARGWRRWARSCVSHLATRSRAPHACPLGQNGHPATRSTSRRSLVDAATPRALTALLAPVNALRCLSTLSAAEPCSGRAAVRAT